ncbi:MAG: hypothetical protein AB8B60_06685, partial [Sulfitobacter sp.]
MKISQIITANKSGLTWGKWSNAKPRKPDFPMSRKKGGSFPLTRKWRWATVKFSALSSDFVVLVAYHSEVPEYQAVLAERVHNDTRTLSRYEYHGNHPVVGWHLHACCGDISALETGITMSYSPFVGQYLSQFKLLFAPADRVLLLQFPASRPRQVVCRQGQNAVA